MSLSADETGQRKWRKWEVENNAACLQHWYYNVLNKRITPKLRDLKQSHLSAHNSESWPFGLGLAR